MVGDYINSFSTSGGATNISTSNTGCSCNCNPGYFFYNNQTHTQIVGGTVNFTFQNNVVSFSEGYKIWVDWNHDGTFNTNPSNPSVVNSGEQVYASTTTIAGGGTIVSGSFTIPTWASLGNTRLRIRCVFATTTFGPCTQHQYGEVEDYNFVITQTCSGTPNAGNAYTSNTSVCPNNAFSLVDTGFSYGIGLTYQWQTYNTSNQTWSNISGATSPIQNFSSGISNTTDFRMAITCSNSGLTNYSNSITEIVNPLPNVNAGSDQNVCIGNSTTLSAIGAVNYSWSGGITNNQSFTPTSTGSYVVTGTDINGCSKKDTVVVTVNALPVVNAGTNQTVCAGTSVTLSGTGAVNYSWSSGVTNNQSFIPSSSSSYVVTGTDNHGCVNKDSVSVSLWGLPTASINANNTAICPNGNTKLTASGGVSYLWSNGDTATTTTINQAGSYYVVAANQFGCTDTSNIITITQKAIPAVIKTKYTGSSIVCQPNIVAYALDMPVGSVTGFSYQWYMAGSPIAGATDSVFNAAITGSYAVAVSGGSNCHNFSLYKPATVKSTPVANCASLSTSTTICAGSFVTLAAPFITNATYTWLKDGVAAGAGSTKSFKAAGNYSVVVKLNGCSDTSNPTIPVVVNPLPLAGIVAASPTTFCAGDSCLLTAQPMGMVVYDWYNSTNLLDTTTTPNYKIGINATMKVLVRDANGCTSKLSSASIKTKVTPVPLVSITTTGSTTISSTGSVKLKATQIGGATYQWYKDGNIINGAMLNYTTAYSGGSYSVAVTKTGCTGYSQAVVVTQTTPKQEGTTINEGSFELSAYPNPVSDVLTITVAEPDEVNGTIQIMDFSGKLILNKDMNEPTFLLEIKDLSSGIYFIRYKDDEGRTGTLKVVKE
jgi:hypothetical protein